ncbi:MAG: hypothetical protein ACOC0N_08250 [Chroococcales cyanobacterium]
MKPSLSQKLVEAEEKIYQNPNDAMVNWNEKDLEAAFEAVGFEVKIDVKSSQTQLLITPHLIMNHLCHLFSIRSTIAQMCLPRCWIQRYRSYPKHSITVIPPAQF